MSPEWQLTKWFPTRVPHLAWAHWLPNSTSAHHPMAAESSQTWICTYIPKESKMFRLNITSAHHPPNPASLWKGLPRDGSFPGLIKTTTTGYLNCLLEMGQVVFQSLLPVSSLGAILLIKWIVCPAAETLYPLVFPNVPIKVLSAHSFTHLLIQENFTY